jgi:monoamine oxidase
MRGSSIVWRALAKARRGDGRAAVNLTRRSLLAGITASAALPLAGCELPVLDATRTRVAIVGGGLAGLNALRLLREARVDARLYEARGRLGGRVFTARGGPVPADDGGQFINGDHADMLAAAKRHGLGLIDRQPLPGRTLVVDGSRVIGEAELARDLEPLAARIATDASLIEQDFARFAPRFDSISVATYLDVHAHALPEAYLRKLIAATIRTEFGQEPEHASALELIYNLPASDGATASLISASDERFVLQGGSGTLVDAISRPLLPWIEPGHALRAVERAGAGVLLHFVGGRTVEAERAIVTVPAPLLRTIDFGDLLPPLWRQFAAEIDVGRNEKLNVAYEGRPWRQDMGVSGDVWPLDGPFAEAWDATTVGGEIGLLTCFMGGAQCAAVAGTDMAGVRRAFEASAAPALPALADSATGWQRRTNWSRDPYARGAYSCFRPGQLTRFASLLWLEEAGLATQAPAVGPLVFAGEHLSDAFPGYMEGGLQTGRLAAQHVLAAVRAPALAH